MILKQTEASAISELQTQEKNCIEKYRRYKEQAKDPVLKDLFGQLETLEQKHYDALEQVLNGQVPSCDCNDSSGRDYEPRNSIWRNTTRKSPRPLMTRARIKNMTISLRPTASEQKNLFPRSITPMFSDSPKPQSANF